MMTEDTYMSRAVDVRLILLGLVSHNNQPQTTSIVTISLVRCIYLYYFNFIITLSFTMNSYPSKPMHSRHDTALIHGLSGTEVQTLSDTSIEAKSKAYCGFAFGLLGWRTFLMSV